MINEVKENELYFAKVKSGAKIPTKESENAGYDIYACFEEDYMVIEPHETKMIPTGLCSACNENYVIILKERGSTGTKGIGQRCGVVDSSYRGEWFAPITNHNDKTLIIIKKHVSKSETLEELFGTNHEFTKLMENVVFYPSEKAICQALLLPVPKMDIKVIPSETLQAIPSKRGMNCLGSSGK